jgi:acetylornithine deacetylase/succinyl-diaminopimelate desuccinylase-like protein
MSAAMGATDGRYYHALTPNVYRFIPYLLGPEDLPRIHGVNERVAVADVEASIRFGDLLFVSCFFSLPAKSHETAT